MRRFAARLAVPPGGDDLVSSCRNRTRRTAGGTCRSGSAVDASESSGSRRHADRDRAPAGEGPFATVIVLHGTPRLCARICRVRARAGERRRACRRSLLVQRWRRFRCAFRDADSLRRGSSHVGRRQHDGTEDRQGAGLGSAHASGRAPQLCRAVRSLVGRRHSAQLRTRHRRHSRGGARLRRLHRRTNRAHRASDSSDPDPARRGRHVSRRRLAVSDSAESAAFEAALRKAGKTVEAVYYENAGHNGIFTDPKQFEDSVRRIAAFIAQSPETR